MEMLKFLRSIIKKWNVKAHIKIHHLGGLRSGSGVIPSLLSPKEPYKHQNPNWGPDLRSRVSRESPLTSEGRAFGDTCKIPRFEGLPGPNQIFESTSSAQYPPSPDF